MRSRSVRSGVLRRPVILVTGLAVAVGGVLIAHTQSGDVTPSAVAPVHLEANAATTVPHPAASATPAATRRPAATPALPPPSGLRVLHASYRFRDMSARYSGAPALDTASGIVIDTTNDTIIWERNPHQPLPPASTTKIVSSLVALENLDPSRLVGATPDALNQAADETRLGILAGDQYTVAELLQAMLTISANDAATVLAADTVGLPRFVRAMNEQVAALGLDDSHFVTPVGLDDPAQMASAYDLAVAGMATYDAFPLFRRMVAVRELDVPATAGHIQYHLHNFNRLLSIYPPAMGIKPGWTGEAGYCLVAMAERGGHRLVVALMNERPHIYSDSRTLFEWAFRELGVPPLPTATPIPVPPPGVP